MSILRLVATVLVFLGACAGWAVLGTTTLVRSGGFSDRLQDEVEKLWGGELVQEAPRIALGSFGEAREALLPAANHIDVRLDCDHRRKGLVWYPTYTCDFAATYAIANPGDRSAQAHVHLAFPAKDATYDAFTLTLDGQPLPATAIDTAKGVDVVVDLEPGQRRSLGFGYRSRGLGTWRYRPGGEHGRARDLRLTVDTDFTAVDYPSGALSPSAPAEATDRGVRLRWTASDLITRQDIGVVMPDKLNPGPLVTRITYFAPVCLLFFFVLVATIAIVRGVAVHPMHYLFVAAGFFAFHLLLAYLVDHVELHLAFLLAILAAVALVTLYLRAALGPRFPLLVSVGGQAFFLALFSYSFFLPGMTGLTVAIGSVLTLAVLMAVTAKVEWKAVFNARRPPPPPAPAAATPAFGAGL